MNAFFCNALIKHHLYSQFSTHTSTEVPYCHIFHIQKQTSIPSPKVYCKWAWLSYFGSTLVVSPSTGSRGKTSWSLLQRLLRIQTVFGFLRSPFALERPPPRWAGGGIQISPQLKRCWCTHVATLKMWRHASLKKLLARVTFKSYLRSYSRFKAAEWWVVFVLIVMKKCHPAC